MNKKVINEQKTDVAVLSEDQQKINGWIDTVNKANDASVLMRILCQTMGLEPSKTSHQQFVQTFSDLQKNSLEAQKELQEKFIATPIPEKRKKTRQLKNV